MDSAVGLDPFETCFVSSCYRFEQFSLEHGPIAKKLVSSINALADGQSGSKVLGKYLRGCVVEQKNSIGDNGDPWGGEFFVVLIDKIL